MITRFATSHRYVVHAVIAAAAACALSAPPLHAQAKPFRLSGAITDFDSFPLEGVRVELIDIVTMETTRITSDALGRFELKVPAGRYRTRVSFRELEMSADEAVEVQAGTAMTLDLELYVNARAREPFCFTAACIDRLPGISAPSGPAAR